MLEIIKDAHFWFLVAAYWVFNAAVTAMWVPVETSSRWYRYLYGFLHILAGNLTSAFGKVIPTNGISTNPVERNKMNR